MKRVVCLFAISAAMMFAKEEAIERVGEAARSSMRSCRLPTRVFLTIW